MNNQNYELEEEFYSEAQNLILINTLFEAKEKFLRKGYEFSNHKMKTHNISDNIITVFENDSEIFYTALMEGHSYVNNIWTDPKIIEDMGKNFLTYVKMNLKKL
jgi:hypothetical protein